MMRVAVVPMSRLARWDAKHVTAESFRRAPHDLRPFGEVARRRVEPADDDVPIGSVHFDGRITRRSSADIAGRTFVAKANDLVYSKIDARNGAVGVLPADLAPLAFTNEYPIYQLTGALDVEYAQLLCRTRVFRSQIQALVVGHSGRKRVQPELFEALPVPVPSHDEQLAVVALHRAGMARVDELQVQAGTYVVDALVAITAQLGLVSAELRPIRRPFVVRAGRLDRWSVPAAMAVVRGMKGELESTYPVQPLGSADLARVTYGIQKSPANRPGEHPRPYLRVANVQDGYVDLREIKYIEIPDAQLPVYRLEPGDLLLCEGNSAELVGRPAMWGGEIPDCVHQNHVLRVRTNPERLVPEYLLAYMQTAPARAHFRRRAKQTTNLATINSTDVRELLVPVPPIGVQEQVAEALMQGRLLRMETLASVEAELRRVEAAVEAAIVKGALTEAVPAAG